VVISLVQTVPITGAVVVTTPSDVSLQDGRKAIEMFKQVKVEVLGLIENMSTFHCPHCGKEIDVFSTGGGERTAKQFGIPLLGQVELDPNVRKGGDTGLPVSLGKESVAAQSFAQLAERIKERVEEAARAEKPILEIR
jgi:ATP-binding protein involved in chromosome partitioning